MFSLWEGSPFGAHQDERVDSTCGIFDATANMQTKLLHCSSSVGMRPRVDKQTEVKRRRRKIECEQSPERHPRKNTLRIIVGPHGKPTITNRIFCTCPPAHKRTQCERLQAHQTIGIKSFRQYDSTFLHTTAVHPGHRATGNHSETRRARRPCGCFSSFCCGRGQWSLSLRGA